MPALVCDITDSRTSAVRSVPLRNDEGDWPVLIGASSDCAIRIDDPSVGPKAVRLDAGGRHISITLLDQTLVVVNGEVLRKDAGSVRGLGDFKIGPYSLQFRWASENLGGQ
jgi:hypothetical protein